MNRGLSALAAVAMLAEVLSRPAYAEIVRSEAALAGRTICWWSGWDSEQYLPDHTYFYSYHVHIFGTNQYVIRGTWSIERDGSVTLIMESGVTLRRKYDVKGDRVVELTGTLSGGADGYFC